MKMPIFIHSLSLSEHRTLVEQPCEAKGICHQLTGTRHASAKEKSPRSRGLW